MKSLNKRLVFATLTTAGVLALSACTSVPYRCPLEPDGKVGAATACASMEDALYGAKHKTGGKLSVLTDEKGRLVPREMATGGTAQPLPKAMQGQHGPSGSPKYVPSKVFHAVTNAYVDGSGKLHDDQHSWFTTPGRWAAGTVGGPGQAGAAIMAPVKADQLPEGRLVKIDGRTGQLVPVGQVPGVSQPAAPTANQQSNAAPQAQQARPLSSQEALNGLSLAANAAAQRNQQAQAGGLTPGVTPPAIQLNN